MECSRSSTPRRTAFPGRLVRSASSIRWPNGIERTDKTIGGSLNLRRLNPCPPGFGLVPAQQPTTLESTRVDALLLRADRSTESGD